MPRLADLLARNLGISRTVASRLIADGRVTGADGAPHTDRNAELPAGDAAGDAVVVAIDGEPVSLWDRAVILQHKPAGVVTALRDNRHPTAYGLLHEAPLYDSLRAVGRLDLDSTGLLLWTTEGALIQRLTHPKRRVPRTYQAALARPFQPPTSDLVLEDGHRPEIAALAQIPRTDAHAALAIPADAPVLATITIIGGAYHEIRRIFAALGSHVLGLCRIAYGDYTLPSDLPAGGWRCVPPPAEGSPPVAR